MGQRSAPTPAGPPPLQHPDQDLALAAPDVQDPGSVLQMEGVHHPVDLLAGHGVAEGHP